MTIQEYRTALKTLEENKPLNIDGSVYVKDANDQYLIFLTITYNNVEKCYYFDGVNCDRGNIDARIKTVISTTIGEEVRYLSHLKEFMSVRHVNRISAKDFANERRNLLNMAKVLNAQQLVKTSL